MIIHDELVQGTSEWFAIRLGRPTASNASKLITPARLEPSKSMFGYAQDLAGDLFAGYALDRWEGNEYTQRGQEIEPEARAWYAYQAGVPVVEVGWITDDDELYGCSPDGLVGDDGLVEIKCLPKRHIPALLTWHKTNKLPTDYLSQVHMQLLVTGRAWCDLVYYSPALPSIIERIERDDDVCDLFAERIAECLKERDKTLAVLYELAGNHTEAEVS